MNGTVANNPPESEINALYTLFDSGDFRQSESRCRRLLESYPESFLVLNLLGVALSSQGRNAEAVVCYEKAIQANAEYADAALEKFTMAVKLDPHYGDAQNNLGVMLQTLNQHESALNHLAIAVRLRPNSAISQFNYAKSLAALGQLEEALGMYDRAIILDSGYFEAYNNRGNVLEALHRLEAARASYTKAIQLKPDYALAYSNRGILQKNSGDYRGAFADFTRLVELDCWNQDGSDQNLKFRLYVNLGDIHMYYREFQQALAAYDLALGIEPDNLDVPGFKGNAIAALGRISEGLSLKQAAFGVISFDKVKGVSILHGQAQ
jgi:tetratricopeptide (TPR) repeat protein